MRRPILIALLALGTVGGYASGFASLSTCHRGPSRRQAFEQHVAQICADAALRSPARRPAPPPAPAANGEPDSE